MPSCLSLRRRQLAALEHRGKASAVGLAGAARGQLGSEVKHIRLLVFLQAPGEETAQLLGREAGIARQHEHVDALAQALVGAPHRKRGRYLRMRAAGEFDLERGDLVAAAVDELLLAPDDLDHARIALACELSRGEPAI